MNKLLADAIEAHGGLGRWKKVVTIETDVVASGQLHEIKRNPPMGGPLHFTAKTMEQICSIRIPANGEGSPMLAVARPDLVTLQTLAGNVIAELSDPRQSFTGHALETSWNPLQRLYFSAYAMWMYLTTPFSLATDGAQVWDIEPLEENGEMWRGIRVVMPTRFATHCRAQEYYFGPDMLLRRQDYTFDIATGIRVANYALDVVDVNGLKLPSKRRAYLCNKKYEVLSDRLMIRLDLINLSVSEQSRSIF